jgi:acyl-CoA synthetase (AMP-forming)/AMP-acid ligase II
MEETLCLQKVRQRLVMDTAGATERVVTVSYGCQKLAHIKIYYTHRQLMKKNLRARFCVIFNNSERRILIVWTPFHDNYGAMLLATSAWDEIYKNCNQLLFLLTGTDTQHCSVLYPERSETFPIQNRRSQWPRILRRRLWSLGRGDRAFESRIRHWRLFSSSHHHSLVTLSTTLRRLVTKKASSNKLPTTATKSPDCVDTMLLTKYPGLAIPWRNMDGAALTRNIMKAYGKQHALF